MNTAEHESIHRENGNDAKRNPESPHRCHCGVEEDLEAEFFGEGLELAELFLLGGGLDREGLALVVGGGIGSLAAARFMIRDGDLLGENITLFEGAIVLGGSLDDGAAGKFPPRSRSTDGNPTKRPSPSGRTQNGSGSSRNSLNENAEKEILD